MTFLNSLLLQEFLGRLKYILFSSKLSTIFSSKDFLLNVMDLDKELLRKSSRVLERYPWKGKAMPTMKALGFLVQKAEKKAGLNDVPETLRETYYIRIRLEAFAEKKPERELFCAC